MWGKITTNDNRMFCTVLPDVPWACVLEESSTCIASFKVGPLPVFIHGVMGPLWMAEKKRASNWALLIGLISPHFGSWIRGPLCWGVVQNLHAKLGCKVLDRCHARSSLERTKHWQSEDGCCKQNSFGSFILRKNTCTSKKTCSFWIESSR